MAKESPQTPEKISRFEAQRRLGLFAGLDYTAFALILFCWMTLGFWALFGHPTALHFIAGLLITLALLMAWLIVLAYRVMVFVLDLHADVALMPEAAARIVVGYQHGNMPKQPTRPAP